MDNFPFKHKPYKHQLDTFQRSWNLPAYALFMEMGTGKSKILIDTTSALYLENQIDGAVVIAKKGEYSNWPVVELPSHMSDMVPWDSFLFTAYKMQVGWGRQAFADFLKEGKLRWLVINIESLATPAVDKALAMFREACPRFAMIVDESTCIKHQASKRSEYACRLAQYAPFRRIATGTAVAESPLDIWGQALVLDDPKTLLGHNSFFGFRGEFATLEPQFIKQWRNVNGKPVLTQRKIMTVSGYKNTDKLKRLISKFSTQLTKDECLDLPEKVYKKVAVPLTPEQESAYNELRDFAFLRFGDEIMEVTSGLAMLTKLHQICCGQLKKEDGTYITFPNNRLETTIDLLENHGKKAIIWMGYQESIRDVSKRLREHFGEEAVGTYYGPTPQDEREVTLKSFENPSHPLKYIVANQKSLGYGRTLLQARLMIYYSNVFPLEQRLQSEDRSHRIGQTEKVTYVDLFAPGTVDERVYQLLKDKKEISQEVVNSSIRRWA